MTRPVPDGPLVVCDLDGTLLRSGGVLSDYTRETVAGLIGAGVAFTIATARSAYGVRHLFHGVRLPLPVVELGGSYLSDAATGRHFAHRAIDPEAATRIITALQDAGIEPALTTWDGAADRLHHGPLASPGAEWFVHGRADDPRLRHCPDFLRVVGAEDVTIVRFSVLRPDEEAARKLLAAACGDRIAVQTYPIGPLPDWVEFSVHSHRADKGTGIAELRSRHALTGPVVACGDHLNDLPMFAVADRRIAPCNARPEILALATDVVGTNDEDGVARFLAAEFLS